MDAIIHQVTPYNLDAILLLVKNLIEHKLCFAVEMDPRHKTQPKMGRRGEGVATVTMTMRDKQPMIEIRLGGIYCTSFCYHPKPGENTIVIDNDNGIIELQHQIEDTNGTFYPLVAIFISQRR